MPRSFVKSGYDTELVEAGEWLQLSLLKHAPVDLRKEQIFKSLIWHGSKTYWVWQINAEENYE